MCACYGVHKGYFVVEKKIIFNISIKTCGFFYLFWLFPEDQKQNVSLVGWLLTAFLQHFIISF